MSEWYFDSDPIPALRRNGGRFSDVCDGFFYQLHICKTNDGSKVGTRTMYPLGFTQHELMEIVFQSKTYRVVFPEGDGYPMEDRKFFRGILSIEPGSGYSHVFDEIYDYYTGYTNLYAGDGIGYETYVADHLNKQRRWDRTKGLHINANWWSGYTYIIFNCFDVDNTGFPVWPSPRAYFYNGLYYPQITFDMWFYWPYTPSWGPLWSSYQYEASSILNVEIFGRTLQIFTDPDTASYESQIYLPQGLSLSMEDWFSREGF